MECPYDLSELLFGKPSFNPAESSSFKINMGNLFDDFNQAERFVQILPGCDNTMKLPDTGTNLFKKLLRCFVPVLMSREP